MIKEFQGKYRFLSNFAPCTIVIGGLKFPSVEHAYMSMKSNNLDWKYFCSIGGLKPGEIKRKSREVQLVPNWESIKLSVMRDAVRQKFNQEPYRTLLIETGDKYIQEGNYWGDNFWGVDLRTNVGENHLGKIIMEIRKNL